MARKFKYILVERVFFGLTFIVENPNNFQYCQIRSFLEYNQRLPEANFFATFHSQCKNSRPQKILWKLFIQSSLCEKKFISNKLFCSVSYFPFQKTRQFFWWLFVHFAVYVFLLKAMNMRKVIRSSLISTLFEMQGNFPKCWHTWTI